VGDVFTELKIDAASLAESLIAIKAQYALSGRKMPWSDFVASYIRQRLLDTPERYVEYGPYWWGVKAALAAKGHTIGEETDLIVLPEYSYRTADGQLDIEMCLAAGEHFKAFYCNNYFTGTRDFALTTDGNSWTLFDDDLEMLAS
jgi:hypothetical protein